MTLPSFGNRTQISVGLLGGSFNPAHDGHVYISEVALKTLGVDQVWWLVSPQNPLKSRREMAPLEKRLRFAKGLAKHPSIKVTDLETRLGTRYTADTLALLKMRYPRIRFVWLMGADNLRDFHRWKQWTQIIRDTPFAVFHRPGFAQKALSGRAAHRFGSRRLSAAKAAVLKNTPSPRWVFLSIRGKMVSATEIRSRSEHWL